MKEVTLFSPIKLKILSFETQLELPSFFDQEITLPLFKAKPIYDDENSNFSFFMDGVMTNKIPYSNFCCISPKIGFEIVCIFGKTTLEDSNNLFELNDLNFHSRKVKAKQLYWKNINVTRMLEKEHDDSLLFFIIIKNEEKYIKMREKWIIDFSLLEKDKIFQRHEKLLLISNI